MKKIIVLDVPLSADQKKRLEKLGEVYELDVPNSKKDFLQKSKGADVILSYGDHLLESLPQLEKVFVTYPYIELGVFDSEALAKKDVFVANAQGGNKNSIAEWTIFMVLALFRQLIPNVRITHNTPLQLQESLEAKKVLIVGKGSIGSRIGDLCKAFLMDVDYFERGDNLAEKANSKDIIINALNSNSSSQNLLNREFFASLKQGSYFISFVRGYTYDLDGLIQAINQGIVAGAAIDCDPEAPGDTSNTFYKKAIANEKILVTPHLAFSTKQASKNGVEIAVQNIEAWVAGKPQNVLLKK